MTADSNMQKDAFVFSPYGLSRWRKADH